MCESFSVNCGLFQVLCSKNSVPSRRVLEPAKDQIWKVEVVAVKGGNRGCMLGDADEEESKKAADVRIEAKFLQLFNPDANVSLLFCLHSSE